MSNTSWGKMAYPNQVFTVFSFLGFLMCLIPLPCHLRGRNIGACLFIFWTGTGCLIACINSIIWNGNAINSAPIWCEIVTRILIANSFGIPASVLCITRRLHLVQRAASEHRAGFDKKSTMIFELLVGLGIPFLSIPIYYISQGNRFNIFEDKGCDYAAYGTWVSAVTLTLPPLLIALVSATYAIRNLIAIYKMRSRFKQLITNHSTMSYSLYFRLMALAGADIIFSVPITGVFVILNFSGLEPWISWDDTHSDFDHVGQYPALVWRSSGNAAGLELSRWLYVVSAIIFFALFGVAEEVRRFYGPPFRYACKRIGICREESFDSGIAFNADSMTTHSKDSAFRIMDKLSTQTSIGDDKWSPATLGGELEVEDPRPDHSKV